MKYNNNQTEIYTVQSGDNLWRISQMFGITVGQLMHANNLTDTLIFPGQQLIIPRDMIYIIQAGDNLWRISQMFGITVGQLMHVNNLTDTLIFPNQQLIIPMYL